MVIAQFVAESKSGIAVTKNQHLCTVYRIEFDDSDSDGYNSDFTTKSKGIFQFNANSAIVNTTANNNSNGKIILAGSDWNVNAAAATKKERPSILKGNRRNNFKSNEMPTGAISKIMANKQVKMMDGDNVAGYMKYSAKMANIDFYSCCDSLVSEKEPVKNVHYKVNLLHSEELEYRVNLSKQDRIIGEKYIALAGGGANGSIIGLDTKILYFNNNGKYVSIGIAGDHLLTGNKLCCGYLVAKSGVGWIKLMWPQGAQVKTQYDSILSIVQIQDNGCLVNDVAIQH